MTTKQLLQRNGDEVDFLRQCLTSAEQGLGGLENAVRVVLQRQSWERRRDPVSGNVYACESFADLMTSDPPRGLGWAAEDVRRVCRGNVALYDLFDQALQRPHGTNQHSEDLYNVQDLSAPTGNSKQAALRKLRKNRPDLHAMVVNEELSPHAAMVEAGFRPRTASVRTDDPANVAAFLAKHFDAETINAIAEQAVQRLKRESAA